MIEIKLLPCPFCGEVPEQVGARRVACSYDECGNYLNLMNIANWNDRAPAPDAAETTRLRTALAGLVDAVSQNALSKVEAVIYSDEFKAAKDVLGGKNES